MLYTKVWLKLLTQTPCTVVHLNSEVVKLNRERNVQSTDSFLNPKEFIRIAFVEKSWKIAFHLFAVFRRTWTNAEELLKEKSFFILSFVFLSEFVIRQVQTNIY